MKLFVSYSHRDQRWLDRLRVHLAPLLRDNLDLWDDRRIEPGESWKDEIRKALTSSNGALLLVSADFLASEFISNEELPKILQSAEIQGTKVLLLIVGPCLFSQSPLSKFQALNSPERPLAQQRKPNQDKVLTETAEKIHKLSAASGAQFRIESGVPATAVVNRGLVGTHVPPLARIDVSLRQEQLGEMIRVSISGLFRIKHEGTFLLVRGHRIGHFQPVGGVLKRWASASRVLDPLGVRDDEKIPLDVDSVGDLRVQVPGRCLREFLDWYRSERNRETHPWREFYEELIAPGILSPLAFPHIATERIGTYVSGIDWSVHLQCWQILISEIFETHPNVEQSAAFAELKATGHADVRWASDSEIRSRGVIPKVKLVADIADNAMWLL